MNIIRENALPEMQKPLGFGKYMTDHMVVCHYKEGHGWDKPQVMPYHAFTFDPCALVLHYGQAIYEGMKAYHTPSGIALFRPERNAARFRSSAARIAMAEMPDHLFIEAISDLVRHEYAWVPAEPDTALYIRPVMVADEAAFGVRRSSSYLFFAVATPVDSNYRRGNRPYRLLVTEEYARAAPGGGGDAKTAGNYGRTIVALDAARKQGFDNVLWLDPVQREFIEEAGITNIFVRTTTEVVTPPLNSRILAGVTRDTVLQLLRKWNVAVSEREMSIVELVQGIADGTVTEVFLTGTATHIAPVGAIRYREADYMVPGSHASDSMVLRLSQTIDDVQRGRASDDLCWMQLVASRAEADDYHRNAKSKSEA